MSSGEWRSVGEQETRAAVTSAVRVAGKRGPVCPGLSGDRLSRPAGRQVWGSWECTVALPPHNYELDGFEEPLLFFCISLLTTVIHLIYACLYAQLTFNSHFESFSKCLLVLVHILRKKHVDENKTF